MLFGSYNYKLYLCRYIFICKKYTSIKKKRTKKINAYG